MVANFINDHAENHKICRYKWRGRDYGARNSKNILSMIAKFGMTKVFLTA
jgi:hypothetical protein